MLLGRWPSTRTATPSPNTKPQALRCVWGHWSLLTAAAAGLCRPVLACGLSTNTDFQGHGQHLHLLGTVDPWEDRKRSAVGGGRAAGDRVMNLWTSSPCFCPPQCRVPRGLGSVRVLGPCSLSPRPRLVQPWWGRLPVSPPPLNRQQG